MPTPKSRHKQAHAAVNTPPSRNPELMRRMYTLMANMRTAAPDNHGLEATLIGALMGLLPEDTLTISHAGAIPRILFGKKNSPELLDLAPIDPGIADIDATAHIALAAGYALDRILRRKPGLVLSFVGESESLVPALATLSFAATHKLPLVVVAQHNLGKLRKKDSPHDLTYEVLGAGLAGMTVDGSDAMAVYRVTQEAMYRARHEGGPTLIECKTCHKAAVPASLRPWVQGDAIAYMEQQLRARGFWLDRLRRA